MLIGDCRAKFHLTIVQDEQEEFLTTQWTNENKFYFLENIFL